MEETKNMTNQSDIGTDVTNEERVTTTTKDTSIDVSSLLKASKEPTVEVKEKSNLEKLKEARANGSLGMVVGNSELEEANKEKTLITNKAEHDAMDHISEYTDEQDKLIEAAGKLTMVNRPTNPIEMVSVIDGLDHYATTGEIMETDPGEKEMFREKTEDDKPVNTENQEIVGEDGDTKISDEKKEIVNILIDKTGLGGDFKFTDEEKEKIFSASEIKLTEVEEVDLSTITVEKPQKSFIDSVEEYQLSSARVPVVFPASRFRAYMTGLSYGEMGDISLNTENVTFDQMQKKLTVIYNKMVNPSIGKFESFEDFLRKFAYVDIDLAVYGLVVATFPEVDDIPLTCNNPHCKRSFNHKFSPRTLIRFEKSDDKFLNTMKEVIECKAVDAEALAKQSPTQVHKRIKLPYSGFIVEIGIASSYDYLYTIVDNILGDKFAEEHPDDVNGILQLNSALLGLIRGVYVPKPNGSYAHYEEFEDMIHALYHVKPEEIAILSSLLQKFNDSYSVTFELFDIQCPHCGTRTKRIPLDISYLVFLKYQRLMSTEINIDNIQVL